jgi:hypothetical protein
MNLFMLYSDYFPVAIVLFTLPAANCQPTPVSKPGEGVNFNGADTPQLSVIFGPQTGLWPAHINSRETDWPSSGSNPTRSNQLFTSCSRYPGVTPFAARTSLKMRVMRRNRNFIAKTRAQPLDRADGRHIIRVASDGDGSINRTHKRSDGATGLKSITVAAKWRQNFISNMPRANQNVLRLAITEIKVAHIRSVLPNYTKMAGGNKSARRLTRKNPDKMQPHLTE